MGTTLDSTLAWWIAGPILGLVILGFFALATKFGARGTTLKAYKGL